MQEKNGHKMRFLNEEGTASFSSSPPFYLWGENDGSANIGKTVCESKALSSKQDIHVLRKVSSYRMPAFSDLIWRNFRNEILIENNKNLLVSAGH